MKTNKWATTGEKKTLDSIGKVNMLTYIILSSRTFDISRSDTSPKVKFK